ncbi:MAG: hypothetical protein SVQ76_02655 [Candidatus Nanohaloarchaea archaeon]|nr:hypothetical protein [Candidatus Nanohaloarchaea archaeon]
MPLSIRDAVENGFNRTLKRNGLMIVAAIILLNLAGGFTGLYTSSVNPSAMMGSAVLLGVFGLALSIVSVAISIIALRVFVSDETESIPDDYVRRNMGWALVHMIVGGVVFALIVVAGLFLLVIPGIYLLLALFFWSVYVAVEDVSFVEAMQRSWSVTKGHKWRLLGLLIVVGLVNAALVLPGALIQSGGMEASGMLVAQVLSGFGTVFTLAAQADAYNQLTG